jgi:uncharacterized membrane protein YphA (DoxX/SURF4 family)
MSNIASKIPTVARVLLGLIFAVFGLNGFLHFIPTPPPSGPAGAFGSAMFATGYLFQLLKSTEVVAGLLLLSNRFVPLALALLALVILVLEVYLARSYRDAYSSMLHARTEPTSASPISGRPRVHAHAG